MTDLHVTEAKPSDAADLVTVIHAAFRARPTLDPPSTALAENAETVAAALREHGGLLVRVDGEPAGAVLFSVADGRLGLRRVSVHPHFQGRGVATAMVGCAEEEAEARGLPGVRLEARAELPDTVEFWRRRGYAEVGRTGPSLQLAKVLPVEFEVRTDEAMRAVGAALADVLGAGDLMLLTGELGAGKTTLTQGLGAGLGVRGGVTSPTFVIARSHPNLAGGPPLVHVDAYRLGGALELDDLDLDTSTADAVTVVEWGSGIAEGLAEDRLELTINRAIGGTPDGQADHADRADQSDPSGEEVDLDPRVVRIRLVGARWVGVDPSWLREVAAAAA